MIDLLFFILLICITAYFYNYPICQSNNAVSTILQIWTGSCNLSCRQSGYSRFSGMSGLNETPLSPCPETPAGGESIRNMAPERMINSVPNCACHPCPCGQIENILRTCRPATDIYTRNMELLGLYLAGSIELISDTYEKISDAMQCGTSCERRAEYVRTTTDFVFESSENLTFDREKTESNKSKTLFPKISEMLHLKTRSETTLRGRSETTLLKDLIETSRKAEENKNAEENNKAEEIKKAIGNKIAEEKQKAEEMKTAIENKIAEEKKKAEEMKTALENKIAEGKKKVEEMKTALENKIAEGKKKAEEIKIAEGIKIAEEIKKAIQNTKAEDKKKVEESKRAEGNKKVGEIKINEENKKTVEAPKVNLTNLEAISEQAGPSQGGESCPTAQLKTDEMPECGSCPRCIQEGKVCISKCPRARTN